MDSLCHSLSSGVAYGEKNSILLLRWAPTATLIRYIVLVVGDRLQSWCLILDIFFAPHI